MFTPLDGGTPLRRDSKNYQTGDGYRPSLFILKNQSHPYSPQRTSPEPLFSQADNK